MASIWNIYRIKYRKSRLGVRMKKTDFHNLSDEEYERLKREVANLRTEVHRLSEELGRPFALISK